jgi:hypothetical protein
MGASDSGAAVEPEPHPLGCNAVSLGEQFQKMMKDQNACLYL